MERSRISDGSSESPETEHFNEKQNFEEHHSGWIFRAVVHLRRFQIEHHSATHLCRLGIWNQAVFMSGQVYCQLVRSPTESWQTFDFLHQIRILEETNTEKSSHVNLKLFYSSFN